MREKLHFRSDGTFVIAQFTDVHWQNGDEADVRTHALMSRVIDSENPDLVVFTGDVIDSYGCRDPERSFREAVSVAEQRCIPWAAVFGNHDTEANVTREQLMKVQLDHEHCVSEPGCADISGVGNFVLTVTGEEGRTGAVLYFLDSGSYAPLPDVGGYDWVRRDQIDWYVSRSGAFTQQNQGRPLPALAFFHIPLPEYDDVWNHRTCYGYKLESVCAPRINTGLFAAMVEMGDVVGTFVGHDHVNDYWGELHGIRLCYGRATGYNTYGKEGFQRGARIIWLRSGKRDFDSWLRLADGTVIPRQPEHQPNE